MKSKALWLSVIVTLVAMGTCFSCISPQDESPAATTGAEKTKTERVEEKTVDHAPPSPVLDSWGEGSEEAEAVEEVKSAPRHKAKRKRRGRSKRKASQPHKRRAGGGSGEGIGLGGGTGTIGHGAGTGTGQGRSDDEEVDDQPGEIAVGTELESPLALVDKLLKRLDMGNLAFTTPETMKLGDTTEVALLLGIKEEVEALKAKLAVESEGPVETAEGVRVAPEMEAALVGPGFSIEAVTPVKQAVGTLQPTRWAWSITPTKDGTQKLHLTLSARIKVEGKDTPYVVQTFSRDIEVEIELKDQVMGFIKEYGQWLWTGVLVPVGMWLWNRRKKKKAASEPPAQEGS